MTSPQTPSIGQPGDPGAQSEEIVGSVETTPEGGAPESPESRTSQFFRELLSASWVVSLLAIVLALIVGAVLIVVANPSVQATAGYLFARPGDFFSAAWTAVSEAYYAMFRGAVFDPQASTLTASIRPLTQSLYQSIPLIFAGLGLAIGFRAGLFNIGAQGQIILGAVFGAFIGFTFQLPAGLHLLLATAGAALGGALWASIAGVLKARTGANEVIVTIMLNNIAIYLIAYLLNSQAFRVSGSPFPESPPVAGSAQFPSLFGSAFRLHWGFVLALLAAVFTWWLLERSRLGFQLRAVGANPHAAATAGMSVNRVVVLTMVLSGALAGLAGASQVLIPGRQLDGDVAASFGFDAITVALLGRSRPLGTVLAGILFGALRSGGVLMQSLTPMPIDIILVVQSVIVLLIAAPPLVRSIFRLPTPGARPRRVPVVKEATA